MHHFALHPHPYGELIMATTNPFAAVDFTKYMADMKVPAVDVDKFVAAQKKNFEAITAANKAAAEGVQAVFQRQAAIARENLEELTAALQELTAAGEPATKVARQAELTKEGYERSVANLKELNDSLTKTNTEVFELLNKRFVEGLDEVKGFVKVAKK